jgi:hypothetical protein
VDSGFEEAAIAASGSPPRGRTTEDPVIRLYPQSGIRVAVLRFIRGLRDRL